jgi:ribosomal protein S27AE
MPEPHDCLINGKPATVDEAAKFVAEHVAAGCKVTLTREPCRCGSTEPYRSSPTPNWMNRWICPKCGRLESR